jgi:hypothetical protein
MSDGYDREITQDELLAIGIVLALALVATLLILTFAFTLIT